MKKRTVDINSLMFADLENNIDGNGHTESHNNASVNSSLANSAHSVLHVKSMSVPHAKEKPFSPPTAVEVQNEAILRENLTQERYHIFNTIKRHVEADEIAKEICEELAHSGNNMPNELLSVLTENNSSYVTILGKLIGKVSEKIYPFSLLDKITATLNKHLRLDAVISNILEYHADSEEKRKLSIIEKICKNNLSSVEATEVLKIAK